MCASEPVLVVSVSPRHRDAHLCLCVFVCVRGCVYLCVRVRLVGKMGSDRVRVCALSRCVCTRV